MRSRTGFDSSYAPLMLSLFFDFVKKKKKDLSETWLRVSY